MFSLLKFPRACGLTAGPRTGGEVGEGGGRKAWANEGKVGGIDLC